MWFEYALFNLVVIAPVLILFLRHRTLSLRGLILAFLLVSLPFIFWDALVADHWWYFNPRYISGLFLGPLPWEEVAFFFTVPVATLYLFTVLPSRPITWPRPVSVLLLIGGLLLLFLGRFYTGSVLIFSGAILFSSPRLQLLQLAVLILLMLIFNGYLTGRPVIVYNPNVITGLRIGAIPIEDFFFGFCLIRSFQLVLRQT